MLSKILIISLVIIWLIGLVLSLIDTFSNNEKIKEAVIWSVFGIILEVLTFIAFIVFILLIAFVLITA